MEYINANTAREMSIKGKLTHQQMKLKESMDYIMCTIKKRAQEGDTDILFNDLIHNTIPFYDEDILHLIAYELHVLGYKVSFGTLKVQDITYLNISWEV